MPIGIVPMRQVLSHELKKEHVLGVGNARIIIDTKPLITSSQQRYAAQGQFGIVFNLEHISDHLFLF
jgi:hypothetical protein